MRDDDTFRLISPDEAVGVGCFLLGIIAAAFAVDEPKQVLPEYAPPRCTVTVQQYGPGERWAPNHQQAACVASMDGLPNHILTSPVEQK